MSCRTSWRRWCCRSTIRPATNAVRVLVENLRNSRNTTFGLDGVLVDPNRSWTIRADLMNAQLELPFGMS
jgi:hypothetical protein